MNTRTSLITITSLTATFVALCAAVFSVTGIAKLFAGAAVSAAVMASALELGKIVSISFLYQYWKEIPKTLKIYLSTAAIVLMIITSAGIYGYLSSAYAKVAATPLQLNADIQTVSGQVGSIEQDIKRKETRLNQLISLRSQQETRLDNLVSKSTTGNNTTIRTTQNTLASADRNVTTLQNEITKLSAKRDSLNGIGITKRVQIETNGDIGTFVYIAKVLGTDLDTVVKWFTLIIVLVFDPLAVALIISVNFLLKQNKEILVNATESVEPLLSKEEPYKIFIPDTGDTKLSTEESSEETPESPPSSSNLPHLRAATYRNDHQYYMRGDFDWNRKYEWENDPIASKYYYESIAPHLKNS